MYRASSLGRHRIQRPGADERLVEQVLLVPAWIRVAVDRVTARAGWRVPTVSVACFHAPGSSESTLRRARTSSPRLVSCVAVAERPCGHRSARTASQRCSESGDTPKRSGSLPTSFKRVEAVVDVEGGVLDSLGGHRAGHLLELGDEAHVRVAFFLGNVVGPLQQQVAHEVEDER